ncbi:MAG: peptidyl-prolyl cis-trans isomerase [Planctomycetota bacterium]
MLLSPPEPDRVRTRTASARVVWIAAWLAGVLATGPCAWGQPAFAPPPLPEADPNAALPTSAAVSKVRGVYNPRLYEPSPAQVFAPPATASPRPAATFTPPVSGLPALGPSGNRAPAGAPAVVPPPGLSLPGAAPNQPARATAEAKPMEGGTIIARVGRSIILASDVQWQIEQIVEDNRDKIPPGEEDKLRAVLMQKQVMGMLDTKLLYGEFLRNVPSENIPTVKENLQEPFQEHEVPRLLKALDLDDEGELAEYLRKHGSSMADVRQQFIERTIAGEWLRQMIPKPKPATADEMLAYYREHVTDYDYPAKARWEELMVRFDKFANKSEAAEAICSMGNEVWDTVRKNPGLRGPAFGSVAQARSQGFTAKKGGLHKWTTKGAMRSVAIDKALFSLKVGQMSNVIEGETGFHIVRVLERKEAGRTPYTEAQASIREALEAKQRQGLIEKQLVELRSKGTAWTVFEGQLNGPALAQRLGEKRRR